MTQSTATDFFRDIEERVAIREEGAKDSMIHQNVTFSNEKVRDVFGQTLKEKAQRPVSSLSKKSRNAADARPLTTTGA